MILPTIIRKKSAPTRMLALLMPEDIHDWLDFEKAEQRRTKTQIVRDALTEAMQKSLAQLDGDDEGPDSGPRSS